MNLPLARRCLVATVIASLLVAAPLGATSCGRIFIDGVVIPNDGGGCRSGELLCGATCAALASDPAHCGECGRACAQGEVCSHGACAGACEADKTACGGACVDTAESNADCGGCGHVCSGGSSCKKGACVCSDEEEACDGICVDLEKSSAHCGSCGKSCSSGDSCVNGSCK